MPCIQPFYCQFGNDFPGAAPGPLCEKNTPKKYKIHKGQIMTLVIAATILFIADQFVITHGCLANNYYCKGNVVVNVNRRSDRINTQLKETSSNNVSQQLEEPKNQFGRMTYWDESYRDSLVGSDEDSTETFSWYCGWEELEPFFTELIPQQTNPSVLVPGIGNDACILDMFNAGYHRLTAFDYAPEGVECAKRMFGTEKIQLIEDLRVADARDLPYDDDMYDAVLDKGTLDSIYLSGGHDKELARKHLGMAVSELSRVLKVGGIIFSVTAACVDAVQLSFDEYNNEQKACWRQIRDGSLYMTEDGYTSNNVDATMLVWQRIR